jgi:hypothetical protein
MMEIIQMNEEVVEALMDLREQIERLPRFNDDHTGVHQDNQTGLYVLRDDVLGCFALYLGAGHD